MSVHQKNVAASVRARLLNHARQIGSDCGLIFTKYALERILYRLSISTWRDTFLLKGALLFDIWFDQPLRPTRDIDLLGFGPSEFDDVAAVFREVCALACDDGMTFDPATVRATGNCIAANAAAGADRCIYGRRCKDSAVEGVSRQEQVGGAAIG